MIEPSAQSDSKTSEQQTGSGESGLPSGQPILGYTTGTNLANRTVNLTENNFLNYFHYRIESMDHGSEYDVLKYSLELNASTDDIPCYVAGIGGNVMFEVEIKYVKDYTDGCYVYDTFMYLCNIDVDPQSANGTLDLEHIPTFKRSETDTEHKKFTVMNVTPRIINVAGKIIYNNSHTYSEAVTYDTVPGFEIAVNDDCIAVYMIPQNNDCLYEGLSVEVDLRYTYDTSGKPDSYIMSYGGRITLDGNLGGYGQFYYSLEGCNGKPAKVFVSVIDVHGDVIKSKGYNAYEFPAN